MAHDIEDVDVQVVGPISRVRGLDEMLNDLYDAEDRHVRRSARGGHAALEQKVRLEAWRRERTSHIARGREYLLECRAAGLGSPDRQSRYVSL